MKSDRENVSELIPAEAASTTDISIENFKVTQLNPDKGITWILDAEDIDSSLESEVTRFKKFKIKLHAEDGLDFELEGNSGEYNNVENEITFSGDLKGKTSNGYTVYTEKLMLKGKEGFLTSDEAVTFIGPFFKITGKGFTMDLKKETLKILKDVNSTFDKESLNI